MKKLLAAWLVAAACGVAAQPLPPVGSAPYPGTLEL